MLRRTALASFIVAVPGLSRAESVEFEVREVSRIGSRVLAKGHREYSPSDIKVHPYERSGKQIAEKFLELNGGFKIGARIFSERELTGFGLIARQSDSDFSWEWFNKASGSIFKKLQGGQTVEVRSQRLPLGEELVQVRFLEDTTLRFKSNGASEDTHHVLIKSGSVLRFR